MGQKEEAPISESLSSIGDHSLLNQEVGEKRKRFGDDDWKPALGKKKIKSPQIKKPKIVKKPPDGRLSFQVMEIRDRLQNDLGSSGSSFSRAEVNRSSRPLYKKHLGTHPRIRSC